jgi:hypothetical protein
MPALLTRNISYEVECDLIVNSLRLLVAARRNSYADQNSETNTSRQAKNITPLTHDCSPYITFLKRVIALSYLCSARSFGEETIADHTRVNVRINSGRALKVIVRKARAVPTITKVCQRQPWRQSLRASDSGGFSQNRATLSAVDSSLLTYRKMTPPARSTHIPTLRDPALFPRALAVYGVS